MDDEPRGRDVLFSIRPFYAEKILRGQKTVELRRRFTKQVKNGALALIYSSSPIRAITGTAAIRSVRQLSVPALWREHGEDACIERPDFDAYFRGLKQGFAILLEDPIAFDRAVPVEDLRDRFGFTPPQSFMYLRQELYSLVSNERLQAAD